MSSREVVEPPILPDKAVRLIPAPAPVTQIFAVEAVRSEPVESMMEPVVAVMLTALAVVFPVTRPLAHNETFLPAVRVMVPVVEVTLDNSVISPVVVADVMEILPAVVIGEFVFIITLLPEIRVMAPLVELTLDETVISYDAPVEVIEIVPEPPADTAPFTATGPAEAIKVIFPDVVVTMPDVVNAPVTAVYEKAQFTSDTLRSVLAADDVTM